MVKPPVIFIVGPTASGKSELALRVAEKIEAEICSMDAFQVYRGLDTGTGKLSLGERRGIPHHLLDIVGPLDVFSVADYLEHAGQRTAELASEGKPVVWVGGAGLYFRALREGLSPIPASDPALVKELSGYSLPQLQEEILREDPLWSAKADLNNPRRLIRALAVLRQTGRPLSAWQEIKGSGLVRDGSAVFLQPSPVLLKKSIEKRVHAMWRSGWREETEQLLKIEGWQASQSAKAIGYSQVVSFLCGEFSEEDSLENIRIKTWQYARRQLTWFRSEENLEVMDPEAGLDTLAQIIDKKVKPQL
jgi:tRNA dimethylallyltransferase